MNDKNFQRVIEMSFASVYPHYITKAEKKNRTKTEVDEIIFWLTGYTEKSLRDYANEVGLKIVISQAHSDTVDTGMVISQTPAAGTQVKPGDTVNVSVSQGPDPEETKTWSKIISIPYQAPASSSTASASNSSGSTSSSSSAMYL